LDENAAAGVLKPFQECFSQEVWERAARKVLDQAEQHGSQWAAIHSIVEKIGCAAKTLRAWVRRAERDQGKRPGLTSDQRQRLKQLEQETCELRRAIAAGRLGDRRRLVRDADLGRVIQSQSASRTARFRAADLVRGGV